MLNLNNVMRMLIIFEARYISSLNKGHYEVREIESLLKCFIRYQLYLSFSQMKHLIKHMIFMRIMLEPS
ncbi:hypothetical protein RZ87_18825 [Enterobacter roggenkampii]|nr:hypothetical protein RZ87_18825 [Enterobacter roggenkampii]